METNTKEDLSKLSKSEITIIREMLYRDKRFVQSKVIYWNEQIRNLIEFEKRLINRQKELVGVCEMCGLRKTEHLRSLPTGEMVCKKCWNECIDEVLFKNSNNLMRS